jgi:hypothetical protein
MFKLMKNIGLRCGTSVLYNIKIYKTQRVINELNAKE